jgi:DNA repair exonuclease SbcCD nuclease subunit
MNQCKVLFVGDPHFKIKNIEYISLFTSKILNIVKQEDALDFVVVAGDLLDNHDKIDVEPLNMAVTFLNELCKETKTFVLVGNHDYKNNQQFLTDHHWMNALKQWKNLTIVDSVETYEVQTNKYLFLPYVPPGRFLEAIKSSVDEEYLKSFKAIFAHQEFYGCKMGPIESKNGDKWDESYPLVISGHVHNKQWTQSNIYYPGSAMQHAFGQSVNNTVSMIYFNDENIQYNEIDLKMPKLIIKYLNMQDVMKPLNFKITDFKKYKIVLNGTNEEFQTFKKNKKYKQLLDEGFKITFKLKNIEEVTHDTKIIKNFRTILHDKIKEENDHELETIYLSFKDNEK